MIGAGGNRTWAPPTVSTSDDPGAAIPGGLIDGVDAGSLAVGQPVLRGAEERRVVIASSIGTVFECIGNGWFGGMLPLLATATVGKVGNIY